MNGDNQESNGLKQTQKVFLGKDGVRPNFPSIEMVVFWFYGPNVLFRLVEMIHLIRLYRL